MKSLIKNIDEIKYMDKPRWYDISFWALLVIVSAFLVCQKFDLSITSEHSYDLITIIKQGDILSFYDIVLGKAVAGDYRGISTVLNSANYNILVYLVLAIWVLPLKLIYKLTNSSVDLLVLTMYSKIFVVTLVVYVAYLMRKIGIKLGFNNNSAKNLAFITVSSSLLLFGSVAFGQLDLLSVALTLVGILFYLDKKYYKFSIAIAFAICFKAFAILLFVPLILLVEKRILHIVKYLVVAMSITIGTGILYGNNPGYKFTKETLEAHYQFKNKIFSTVIEAGNMAIILFIFSFLLISFYCYYMKPKENEYGKYIGFIGLLVFGSFALFVKWHPQYLVMIVPYVSLCIMYMVEKKFGLLLDFGISLGYVLSTVIVWQKNVDNYMVNYGILPRILGYEYTGLTYSEMYEKLGIPTSVLYTVFASCIVGLMILSYIELFKKNYTEDNIKEAKIERSVIWSRMLVLVGFLVVSIGIFLLNTN